MLVASVPIVRGGMEERASLLIADDEWELLSSDLTVSTEAARGVHFVVTIPERPAAPNSQVR